jgi:hypothetical protein
MVSVRDTAETVKLITDIVNNTISIIRAINDGQEYLKRRHPDAQRDWAELISEMQLTIEGLAEVTKVLSGFRFGIGIAGQPTDADLGRFNDYIITQRAKVVELNNRIKKLKGSSGKVSKLRDDLNCRAGRRSWSSMWGLLGGKGRQQAEELASILGNFYADDLKLVDTIEDMIGLAESAVAEVEAALGPPGLARAFNIPDAAALLGVYSTIFKEPQLKLDQLAQSMEETRSSLSKA